MSFMFFFQKVMKFALLILFSVVSAVLSKKDVVKFKDGDRTEVVMIEIMFRHGARSYIQNYPAETVNETHWDQFGGYGKLTDVGIENLYDLGKYIKKNYEIFIQNSTSEEVGAMSTNYNRALDSTKAFLRGANFDDVPIKKEADKILFAKGPCPRYTQLKLEARNTSEYLSLTKKHEDFIGLMSVKSGITDLSFYHMWEIADHYLVNLAHGLPISNWIEENLETILWINDYTFYIDFVTIEMGRLVSGGLLNSITENIKTKAANENHRKLYVYGIHDNYMAGMQKLLGFSDDYKNPEFASSYIFELRKDRESNFYVKVLFRNDKFNEGINYYPVVIKGCEELCPVDRFLELMKDKVVRPNMIRSMCDPRKEDS